MLKETELKILSSFFPDGEEKTIKTIMRKSHLSYEPVYRTTKQLEKKDILMKKRFGNTIVYSANFEKEELKATFFLYAKDNLNKFSKKHRTIFNTLSNYDDDIDFLAVFGSYAKGGQLKESDIDVLCVSPNKKKYEREITGLKYETGLNFAPVIISKSEFKKIKRENIIFWKDLVKFGIIFRGYELFYSRVYLK